MQGFPSRAEVERIKAQYPEGTRICCDYMSDDPNPIPSGTAGKVQYVDDIGTLHCAFDNGRQLGLVPGVDSFHVVKDKEAVSRELVDMENCRYGDVYVTTCFDSGIARWDNDNVKHICEGYFCQVYSDPEFNDEIDNFCLAVGFEIDDISDSSVETGILAYLGLSNEELTQNETADEDETHGMSIDL